MKNNLWILLVAIVIFSSEVKSAYLGTTETGIPIFSIDLSLNPKDRFKETTEYFKEDLNKIMDSYLASVP